MRRPALELLSLVLTEHDLDRTEARVIPCMHEQLAADIDFLKAAATRFNGILFDLDADEWEAPLGPLHSTRAALLIGIARGVPGALSGDLVIEEIDGRVVARVDGHAGPAEASLVAILRAAAVIASVEYDVVDITWLCADFDKADAVRSTVLWSMLTADPVDLGIAGPKTIVPVLGRRIDPTLDYLRVPPVKLIVRWDRVLRRSESRVTSALREIADRDGPVVLFLGAGASASSGIALGNFYRDLALQELLGEGAGDNGRALADQFFDYLHEQSRFLPGEAESRAQFGEQLTLERVLRETFFELGARPRTSSVTVRELVRDAEAALGHLGPGRLGVQSLAESLKGRLIIVTVNFDELIESDMPADHFVCVTPEDFASSRDKVLAYLGGADLAVPILKIHGTISKPDSLVGSLDDTAAGLPNDVRAVLDAVLTDAQPMTWVWIGCSMRDRDVTAWLGGLARNALEEWWVDPLPGDSLDRFVADHRRATWAPMGRDLADRLIIESADNFLRRLASRCRELRRP